jgi:NitT/TauT family transport system substrate-binding protein
MSAPCGSRNRAGPRVLPLGEIRAPIVGGHNVKESKHARSIAVTPGSPLAVEAGAAMGAIAAVPSLISVGARAGDLVKVDMQLGWLASNGLLGEVVAMRKGFYTEEGVELTITPGGPNVDGVASVAAGRSTLGQLSSSPSLMLARSAGIPVKAFCAGYHTHPFTYFSLKKDPIREPRDMIGKTIATQPTAFILARALLAKNGIAEDQVKLVNMGSDMNQLMTGQADAVTGWLTNTSALAVLGDQRVDMRLWDTGIQLYANVYYTTDKNLAEEQDALVRYLKGSARGWGYAKEHPEEAVDMLVTEYPILDKAAELQAVHAVIDFSFGDATKERGWGGMTRENWQAQIDIYAKLDQFKGEVPKVDDVMTLAILDGSKDIRMKVG